MTQTPQPLPLCPGCGTPRSENQPRCWLCGNTSTPQPTTSKKSPATGASLGSSRSPATFGLDTLLLTITLVAVCLGLGAYSPSLGILLAIIAGPAYIRALLVVARRKHAGGRSGIGGKIEVFFVSLAVMAIVVIASLVAFVATCFPLGLLGVSVADGLPGNSGIVVIFGAFGIGLAAAGVVAWLLLRWAKNLS